MRGLWTSTAITVTVLLIGVGPPGLGESLAALLVGISAMLTLARRLAWKPRRALRPPTAPFYVLAWGGLHQDERFENRRRHAPVGTRRRASGATALWPKRWRAGS